MTLWTTNWQLTPSSPCLAIRRNGASYLLTVHLWNEPVMDRVCTDLLAAQTEYLQLVYLLLPRERAMRHHSSLV